MGRGDMSGKWGYMNKIMLTIFAICVTILFVGCENGNLDTHSGIKNDISYNSGEGKEYFESGDENRDISNETSHEEVYKYNESG